MAGSVKGLVIEIGGDTSSLQKALSKVNSSTASLSKELRGVNSLLKLDPSNTEMLSQKQTILKNNIEETSAKLEKLKEAQKIADDEIANGTKVSDENYRSLQREIVNTENKLNSLKAEASNWTRAGRSIEEFGKKVENISNKLDKIGTTITTRLTLPIAAIATGAVNSAKEFETAFTGVEKTVDGTKQQIANLKQGIKDMAEEIPSSTTEISAVAEAAGQLGIQTDNILSFSKAMIDLGNSTNLTADEAASQLAKFANITQMSQKDFDKLGSSIVDLGNNFATTEADIVNMAMRLAGAGHQVGMSEGQILGLATALSSVGIEAEMGGSAISKAMVKMQNAVEQSGDKLNKVLNETGMSLRDLELLSANNSKDFKDLCQSIGMTSTEVKQLITAGTNLEDFASVSGMTAEQFKKAWKEDAAGALSEFIKGLGHAQDKGESAITMLSEMGLTEVRLRDSLLRAANAGDLFNNALETGTKSWNENVALTNEANKRYQTLDSRLKMTTNKINNMATSMGNKLTPTVNKVLDKVDGLIDKIDGLTEEETENIIKTATFVAAIGPAIKIVSKLGSTIGKSAKAAGTLSQAIGLVGKTSTESFFKASENAQLLAKILTALASPTGILGVASAITVLSLAYAYFTSEEVKAQREAKKLADTQEESRKKLEEYNSEIEKNRDAELSHINSVQSLRNELTKLVDENGKVKEGYEGRVSFILNEMNNALGTEYKLNGNVIDSYKTLQAEIDKTIEKKRAEIKLKADEEKYKNAIKNQKQAVEELKNVQDKLGMSYDEVREKYGKYIDKINNGTLTVKDVEEIGSTKEYKKIQQLAELSKAYESAKAKVKIYTDDVKTYEDEYAKYTEGKYSEIGNIITTTTEDWTTKTVEQLTTSISEQGNSLEQYKNIYETTGNEVALQLAQQAQNNLDKLAAELANRTQTLTELGPNEISAWKNIAEQSYSSYSTEISKMSPEMQQKIQDATGIIAAGTPQMQEKAGELGKKTVDEFDKSADAKQKALSTISGYLKGLDDETKKQLLKQAGIEDADTVLKELDKGDISEKNGKNILEGLWKGLQNGTWQGKILGAAAGLADAVNKKFTGKSGWDEHSPSKKMKKFAEYYIQPISDVMNKRKSGILNTAQSLVSSINDKFDTDIKIPNIQDFGKLQGNLSSKVIDGTKTIFTTPQIVFNVQELDKDKLEQCFNYVNKKFGSQY